MKGHWTRSTGAALACVLGIGIVTGAAAKEEAGSSAAAAGGKLEIATFAGGCFWCVESDFDHVPGVIRTISGYTGGHVKNPTYRQVVSKKTGHREAVQIHFDPTKTSYETMLEVFWRSVDPTDPGGQFCDRGMSYSTAVFYNSEEQRRLAEKSKREVDEAKVLPEAVVTTVEKGRDVLSGGGLPPGLLSKEPDPIPLLPDLLWPRCARRGAMGGAGPSRDRGALTGRGRRGTGDFNG